MRDTLLFVAVPYVAVVAAVAGLVWRGALRLRRGGAPPPGGLYPGAWARRVGLGGILLEHLAGFAMPAALLAWTRTPTGFLVMEGLTFTFAGLALVGCLLGVLFGFRSAWREGRTADTLCAVLLVLVLVSGTAVSLMHRGSTGWYAITIVPYLQSLVALEPRLDLVAPLPFVVRLHVLGGFVLLGLAPFHGLARAARGLRRADTPAALQPGGLGPSGEQTVDA